jgi:hypothetical protein
LHAIFFMEIHYMAHNTNLVVLIFFNLLMVAHLKDLLQSIYIFFYKPPKSHLKLIKLAQIMETKGNKLLRNIKFQWIGVLNLLKHVLEKYYHLLMKIEIDSTIVNLVASTLD